MSIQHMQLVFDAGDLTAPQKAVLLAYCNFTDSHGYCWPGVERIADMTGLSASGVKKVRKQLIDLGLLKTVSRGKQGGGRATNASRININRLKAMQRPERVYDDNVMAGLGFEEDETTVPSGGRNGTPEGPKGTPEVRQRYLGGTNDGSPGGPYPSVDPSDSSSSARVEAEAAAPLRSRQSNEEEEEKKTTKTKKRGDSETETVEDRATALILTRLADHSPTEDEARAVITHIRTQATQHGTTIARIDKWIDGRDTGALAADLAHVRATTRRHQRPGTNTCKIHGDKRLPCIYCRMSAHAGDWTDLITELQRAGVEERPDLDALVREYGVEHLLAA